MSYRCEVCAGIVSPGKPKLRHSVRRPDQSILREVAVCDPCHAMLAKGAPLADVARQRGPRQPDPLPVPPTPVPAASMAPPVYRPVVLGARR